MPLYDKGYDDIQQDYVINTPRAYHMNNPAIFGIQIDFSRNYKVFIFKYYVLCGILVSTASFSFLIDPKCVSGRAGLLLALLLILSNFFIYAQVISYKKLRKIVWPDGRKNLHTLLLKHFNDLLESQSSERGKDEVS